MKKQILAAGFVVFSIMLPVKATASEKIEQIYTFGDSLSDVGNVYNATLATQKVGYPPPPYFKGRFSNGIVWVEYLAEKLKLKPVPFTTLTNNVCSVRDGVNYAFGGSSSGLNNAFFPNEPIPGTLAQVNLYTSSLAATKKKADPNALYIVWAGANDYLNGNVTNPQQPVQNISKAVTTLANVGAKHIMVLNLGDLGKLPGTRRTKYSTQLTQLTNAHNLGLSIAVKNLSSQLEPKVNLMLVDANTLLKTVSQFPGAFGFTNVTDACFTNNTVCSKPDQYLFWDDIHPTTSAHKQVQKLALSVLKLKLSARRAIVQKNTETVEIPGKVGCQY
jgi:phospholipase/lecithinase/hemolysin